MHCWVVCILTGAFGLLAGAASAPAPSLTPDICTISSTTTVYVTLSAGLSAVDSSKLPTSTLTLVNALYSTTTVQAEALSEPTSASPVSSTVSEVTATSEFLAFVVEDGTTIWLNGPAPPTTESFVVITSTATVFPIQKTPSTITSRTTIWSAKEETKFFTVTKTLDPSTTTLSLSSFMPTRTSPHFNVWGSGGWNTSSTGAHISKPANTSASTLRSVVNFLTTKSMFDIYQSYSSTISLSVMLAKSGFTEIPVSSLAAASSKSVAAVETPTVIKSSVTTVPSYSMPTIVVHSFNNTDGPSVLSALSPVISASGFVTAHSSVTLLVPSLESYTVGYSSVLSSDNTTDSRTSSSVFSISYYPTPTSFYVRYTSTPLYSNISSGGPTSTAATLSQSPSSCGEYGDFALNFDDIPPLAVGNLSASSIQPEPVFSPYHQFDFSLGFAVVPPPTAAYLPSSPPLMLEFVPDLSGNGTNPEAGYNTAAYGFSGQISDGDHGLTGCFTFNMYSATFGCNSTGPPCEFTFTGLQYDVATDGVSPITSQTISVTACPTLVDCKLRRIMLDDTFVDLNAIRIRAAAGTTPQGWWMDDLHLGWFNNSCTTGLCRQNAHIRSG